METPGPDRRTTLRHGLAGSQYLTAPTDGETKMRTAADVIDGRSVSEAWLKTVIRLNREREPRLFHVITRIAEPTAEIPIIRAAADELLEALNFHSVRTVANTIFPQALAATTADSDELAERYRAVYRTLKQLDKHNRPGTYFLRLVSYPAGGGRGFDQLSDLIRKLRKETKNQGPKSARYEVNIESAADRERSTAYDA